MTPAGEQSAIRLHADFHGGNGRDFVPLGQNSYGFYVDLYGGERGLWFHFQIDGAIGAVTFELLNADRLLGWPKFENVRPVFGRSMSWQRTDRGCTVLGEQGRARFTVPCRKEGTQVALCYPYTLEHWNRFRKRLGNVADVQDLNLGRSDDGWPIPALRIGTGPQGVWLTARHHAGETTGSYALEGVIESLLDHGNRDLLDRLTFRICPIVDVDNVQRGAYGKYGPPCDPWVVYNNSPAIRSVAAVQAHFAAAEECPILYADFHAPEPYGSTFACTWDESQAPAEYCRRVDRFCAALARRAMAPLKLDPVRTRPYPGWLAGPDGPSGQLYFMRTYGCPSVTLEVAYNAPLDRPAPSIDDYHRFGHAFVQALRDHLQGS